MSFTIDNQSVMFDLATFEALGVGRVRHADDFNNASNLGEGTAFERDRRGYGELGATAQATRNEYVEGRPFPKFEGAAGA